MKNRVCLNCSLAKACRDSAISWFFFFIALIAAIAVRLVNVVLDISMLWAKVFWYIGIVGFAVYFIYKFREDSLRRRYITDTGLNEKVRGRAPLTEQDYATLSTILCSLRSRKDAINYFFIFFTSAAALLFGLYQDFLAK